MPPLIQAEADLGTLIYIIIVFLWVVGNLVGTARKKKRRGGTPIPRAGESSAEQELREFLEKLAGKPEEPEEEEEEFDPRQQPRPQPQPVRAAPSPAPTQPPRHARPHPVRQPAPTSISSAPSFNIPIRVPRALEEITPMDVDKLARELRDTSPSGGARSTSVLSSMESIFTKSAPVVPSLRYAFGSMSQRPDKPVVSRTMLKNRDNLRRLYASRIILGPPRALDPFQADTEATRRA